jgi:hypothetical protein
MSVLEGKKFLSMVLGRACNGTVTFLAFLISSSLMWETFLWLTLVGSCVGTYPGNLGKLEAMFDYDLRLLESCKIFYEAKLWELLFNYKIFLKTSLKHQKFYLYYILTFFIKLGFWGFGVLGFCG